MPPAPRREHLFRHRHRLHGQRVFDAVFAARCRKNHGPLSVLGLPNDLPHHRLGLVVARRVGNAVQRHRIKRMLREAFRLGPGEVARGYDIVIVVRPHQPASLEAYQRWLGEAIEAIDQLWQRRGDRSDKREMPPAPSGDESA